MVMGAGIGIMILGFLMMIGGGYSDLNTPNYDVKYGFRTTVLAPMLVLAGLFVNGFAIMKKPATDRVEYVINEVYRAENEKPTARTESGKRLRKKVEPSREEVSKMDAAKARKMARKEKKERKKGKK